MNKIELRHTCIIIHNYEMGDCEKIERKFSIWNKGYHRFDFMNLYYDEENKDLYLPSGIDLGMIFDVFGENDVFHKIDPDPYDQFKRPSRLKNLPRNDIQRQTIDFCLGRGNYINNHRVSQLFVNLNTGAGKTYILIAVTAYYGIKTALIMNSLDWLEQWKLKIMEHTDTTEDEIYVISGAGSIAKLLQGYIVHSKIKYYLVSHATLRAYGSRYGFHKIRELFQYLGIGIKIFDEAHRYPDNIFLIDCFTDVWKTYYLTATPILSDPHENTIYQRSYKRIPKINLFDAKKDPRTEYVAILFNSHPSPIDLDRCVNVYGFSLIKYVNYLVVNQYYYKLLWVVMDMVLQNTEGKILVYIGTNFGIQRTYEWLKYYYPGVSVGRYSSLVPKEQKRKELNNKIILTTLKSAGENSDIPELEKTIVLASPFNSAQLARQTLGRTRERDTMYIDIVDVGFPALNAYYKNKQKVFKKYATACKEIRLNDYAISNSISNILNRDRKFVEDTQKRTDLKQVIELIER